MASNINNKEKFNSNNNRLNFPKSDSDHIVSFMDERPLVSNISVHSGV